MVFSRQLIQSSFALALIFSTALSSGVIAVPPPTGDDREEESHTTVPKKAKIEDPNTDFFKWCEELCPSPETALTEDRKPEFYTLPFDMQEINSTPTPKVDRLDVFSPEEWQLSQKIFEQNLQKIKVNETENLANIIRFLRTGGPSFEGHKGILKRELHYFSEEELLKIWRNLSQKEDHNFFKELLECPWIELKGRRSFSNQLIKIQDKFPFWTYFTWTLYGDTKTNIKQLCEAICQCDVRGLYLDFHLSGSAEGVKATTEILKIPSDLRELNLAGNNLTDKDIDVLSEALKINSSLQVLTLGGNKIGNQGVRYLSEFLKTNSNLQVLHLNCNIFRGKGVHHLCEALTINSSLKKLYLAWNNIPDAGVYYLSELLKTNSSLQVLGLNNNKFGDEEVRLLSEGLKINTGLKMLNLHENIISDAGVRYLCEALTINRALKVVDLTQNNITDQGQLLLRQLQESRPDLIIVSE